MLFAVIAYVAVEGGYLVPLNSGVPGKLC